MRTKNEQPLASIDKEKKEKYSKKTNSRAPQRKNRKSYPDNCQTKATSQENKKSKCWKFVKKMAARSRIF